MPQNPLLEIGTEEIPARFMEAALTQLQNWGKEVHRRTDRLYGGLDLRYPAPLSLAG